MELRRGLHSEPAEELVNLITPFNSQITIRNISKNTTHINAKSLNNIALSNISIGDEVEIAAYGADAKVVIGLLQKLVENEFFDPHSVKMTKTVLSGGVAIGTLCWEDSSVHEIHPAKIDDVEAEIEKLGQALESVYKSLSTAKEKLSLQGLHDEAAIFDAHMLILMDGEVISSVKNQIRGENLNSAYVYREKMVGLAEEFRKLSNEYMRERAADLLDVAKQVIFTLDGKTNEPEPDCEDVILVAHEVT
ncbi:MAG: HPr family phosphocarrier protein, partial [Deferribacteraceae bacterium]|nr:HPr family phosphocarrier protein [Deferribacteraceae bacterium]